MLGLLHRLLGGSHPSRCRLISSFNNVAGDGAATVGLRRRPGKADQCAVYFGDVGLSWSGGYICVDEMRKILI